MFVLQLIVPMSVDIRESHTEATEIHVHVYVIMTYMYYTIIHVHVHDGLSTVFS